MADPAVAEAQQVLEEAQKEAQSVLDGFQLLRERVQQAQAEFEGARFNTLSVRDVALSGVRQAKADVRNLAKQSMEAARRLQKQARRAEGLYRACADPGAADRTYEEAQRLADSLQEGADSVRDFADQVYDSLVEQDRQTILQEDKTSVVANRNKLQASVSWRRGPEFTASRRDFSARAPGESLLTHCKDQRKQTSATYTSAMAATPAAGAAPIGVRMNGEPTMPTGWSIPGDPSMKWMWSELTIIGTQNSLLLPIRRCEVAEVTEALGKMLGKSHEDFKLFIRQGSCIRRLLATDVFPSRAMVKGISSWERQRQTYNHPFAIIGAGHNGLRQALACLKKKTEDFVIFERMDKIGGEAWLRLANRLSKLQTEFGAYHLQFDDIYPAPTGMPTWPSRDDILQHFELVAKEQGILPHIKLEMHVSGMKIDKMSRLEMLESGKGDGDPNAQNYKLSLQNQAASACISDTASKTGSETTPSPGEAAADGTDEPVEGGAPEPPVASVAKTTFQTSAVMMLPGNLSVPREHAFTGEDAFGGYVAYGMYNTFDYEKTKDNSVAICGMGSQAVENMRICIEHSARQCYLVCRRKNLAMPRAVSWFINQSTYAPSAGAVLRAMLPMYSVANDDPMSYYAVSPDATQIQQGCRFPVSDLLFLAQHYGRVEVVVGEVKRLQQHMVVLEEGRKLNVSCIIKAFGYTGSFDVDRLLYANKMFGYWPEADFRRWVFCDSPDVDFLNITTTSLSPMAMRVVDFPLHFLAYPTTDFKELVDGGNMHWQSADQEACRPAYVLGARDAVYTTSLVITSFPLLCEREYDPFKRRRQRECHPLDKFIQEASDDWSRYCDLIAGEDADDQVPPPYPYSVKFLEELDGQREREGKRAAAERSVPWTAAGCR
eukprot:CAMPEP_0168385550 /NCGR_PEP_ID=MMETSP0228-20121227/14978_1 /TAXON_ID=133427 /ORGANISM="Protoceratium reticulatum, Strain CCCM 535 (=CCMP 1889)" /LENGTH=888 /DNA_ID=CAMNT_0008398739 /DNA_START=65 /DNA_END=2728 /DNA_ORIENTATION=+